MVQSFWDTRLTTNIQDYVLSADIQQSAEREQREAFFQNIRGIAYFIGGLFLVVFILLLLSKK